MISSTYKPKASKSSSREFTDYQVVDHQSEENYDAESLDGDSANNGETNRRFSFYNNHGSKDGRYNRIKSKQTEYKSNNRGNNVDRKGYAYGGRGITGRRGDYTDVGLILYTNTKGYESELNKKNEMKFNLPEDTRISKLLRRLTIESDQENSLAISKKLLEVLMLSDNAHYIRKSFHILGESMLNIFQTAPGVIAKRQAARGLGRMAYVLGDENDFERFQNWFFSKLSNGNEDLQHLFMHALKELVGLENEKSVLQKHAFNLMRDLVVFIEVTDNVDIFKEALQNLMWIVELYNDDFYPLFRDTIDLLFGWHVDHTQPLSNVEFISKNMQRIAKHFQSNLEFSVTLVLHFVEDIETYTMQLHKKEADTNENSSIEHVTVFILALNTVLKCLGDSLKNNNEFVSLKLLTDCLNQIVKTATDTLESYVPDNLTIAANECISILLEVVGSKTIASNNAIFNLIDLELSLMQEFCDATIISMLLMISKIVKEISANLPIELIPKLVGPKSEIIKYRNSFYADVQEAVICVYQSLLNLKNIPLLQEAYKYVLGDLEIVYKLIIPDLNALCVNNPFEEPSCQRHEAEVTVLFLLRCLSQLANESSSIIGMWALKPSILELLGVSLQPFDMNLSKRPALQYSLLYLLHSHCKCYNYFVSSSTLITVNDNVMHLSLTEGDKINIIQDVSSKSPNSGNLSVILCVIYKTLKNKLNIETNLLLLNWLQEILVLSYTYLEFLCVSKEFNDVVDVIIAIGYNTNVEVSLLVCKNLETLLSNKQLCWKNSLLLSITDLCSLHVKSNSKKLRESYVKLSTHIPWDIVIMEFGKVANVPSQRKSCLDEYNNSTVITAQHVHTNNTFSEMLALHFKTFMKYLLEANGECKLQEVFLASWPIESELQTLCDQFREIALTSRVVLNNWGTWESAQFCVNNKLRTPLGKPNETFTSIENALKDLHKGVHTDNTVNPERVRLLLQFMEHLELLISNASDGCAMTISQPSKPVRTFFTTNASPCKEWLSRIRMILIQLALHTGQSTIALRHGYSMLKDLYIANDCGSVNFERAVIHVTLALLNLRESEALNGLYLWTKNVAKRNFKFIKIAADQASNKYESVITNYKNLIKEDEAHDKTTEDKTNYYSARTFVREQLLNSYKELHDWYEITQIKGEKLYYANIDNIYADTVYSLEKSIKGFNEMNSWKETNKECEKKSWSVYESYRTVEHNLYDVAYNIGNTDSKTTMLKLDNILKDIRINMQEMLVLPSEFLQEFCLLNYIANGLKNILNNIPANSIFLVSEEFENRVLNIDSRVLTKILWWSEYFAYVQTQGFNAFCNNLRLNIVKKSRKERNFELASTQLYKFLEDKDLIHLSNHINTYSGMKSVAGNFVSQIPEINMWTIDTAKAINEMIKLLYEDQESRQLTFNMCAVTSTSLSKYAELFGGQELREVSSKILLKLAKWLQTNEQVSLTEMNSLGKFLMVLPEIGMIDSNNIIPMNEMAIGKLLQFSVHQCNTLAKAWYEFGSWCYRWGRKVIGKSSDINLTLTDEDRTAIERLLPEDVQEDDSIDKIIAIISQTRNIVDDEDIDSNEINTSEMILGQLNDLGILHEDVQLNLVEIWRKVQKRVYIYYEQSAESYFKYLHLIMNVDDTSNGAESNSITVTLRLLRLIVKHALELQNVLEDGLASTPTHPWKVIIPQLFSRLNHPEGYVRQRVSDLLRRIAEDAPHLITFPAVVGALEGGVKFDFSEISLPKDCLSQSHEHNEEELNEIDDYDNDVDDTKNDLQGCFKLMVDTLSKQAPETINQVQLFVKELRRIILLWDELWLGTLAQHHSEINKIQLQLELEIEKVNENVNLGEEEKASLITEKYRIIIKPIIFIIEQLNDITSADPETPHEKKFQERYSEFIKDVLNKLKNPQNPDKPEESWQLIKMLQSKFQQKVSSKGSYMLKMAEISPVLSNMRDTVIAMPGSSSTKITISHVSNHVSILPTKTKPKKLIFHGSDGQNYTYLFKGLEDLHLDERIMQFLSIANTMMAHNGNGNLYRARHYSVIPLGPRSGLISWVDGTTPVFALYKRWQQREATKQNKNNTVMRPSELFYHKLNPLLQENGVKNLDNRKEWPFAILKQVLSELMSETPKDLITKELWCHSINSCAWWQMIRKYSYSVAVMSIIGYIIGLGDRHLDNVLIDLNTGEVVHIDYNVCFEKGKTLKVPEKVPFRLTPNFVDALGVTGTEGIFRLTCENVLKTMKKGRETLLTLLEAFVYDPLVDWTVGGGSLAGTTYGGVAGSNNAQRQNHKELERDVTLSMYNVRCAELKFEWEENRDEIRESLPKLRDTLTNWLDKDEKLAKTEDWLQDLHQQMALIKEAEANGISKHTIYSLPNRYESYKKKLETMNFARGDLEKLATECDDHLQKYSDGLKILESPKFNEWFNELTIDYERDVDNINGVFDLVKEFLQNAGKINMINQCEQSENDVGKLSQKQIVITLNCLHLLRDYVAVLSQCPSTFIERHRMYLYLKWCKYLQEFKSVDSCDVVYQQLYGLLEIKNSQLAKTIVKYSYGINLIYNETVKQVGTIYEELNKLKGDEGDVLDKNYNDAKMSVTNFLRLEKQSTNALEFVIVNELLILNQHFISLETVASRSGDYLLKLTLREGDWFLDELSYCSDKSIELLSYLPINSNTRIDDVRFIQAINGIQAANNVYKCLQELNVNFHKIILPETMKKVQSDETTVVQMIQDLNNIIVNVGMPLGDLVARLEKNLKCVVMKMDKNSANDYVTDNLKSIKSRYHALLQSSGDQQQLSQGKMLLMGFNGLFDKLDVEFNNLITILSNIEVPTCWRKLDQVKDAKSLSAPIYDVQVKNILSDIFLLKRIQSMSEFFTLCMDMCPSFRGLSGNNVDNFCLLTDEQLNKPIRKYTADFISRQFLGITTEIIAYTVCFLLQHLGLDVTHEIEQKDIGAENKVPLDELSHKSWNQFLKNGIFTHNVLAQASSLETNLKTAWEKLQEPKKIEKNLSLLQSTVVRLQNQIMLYNWIFDDILMQNVIMPNCNFTRNKFIAELRTELTNLTLTQEQLNEKRDIQQDLITSVTQRLNWASGANPDVNEVLSAFEAAIKTRDKRHELHQQIVNVILSTCQIILNHELHRSQSPETKTYDQQFLNYLDKFRAACQYNDKLDTVTSVEENIMHLYTADLTNNPRWVTVISEKISDIITTHQKELSERKCDVFVAAHSIMESLEYLKQSYGKHGIIMGDFKSLLKSMTKIDEYAQQTMQFIVQYRKFIESFGWLTNKFMEMSKTDVDNAMKNLNYLNDNIDTIYESLLNLKEIKLDYTIGTATTTTSDNNNVKIGLIKQESINKGQQKNAYAVSVWRRVKMKLEGRDPDPGRKYLTQEQVDYVIREATSLDNLALLYEGWTPWV